jgi:hypothetical protein
MPLEVSLLEKESLLMRVPTPCSKLFSNQISAFFRFFPLFINFQLRRIEGDVTNIVQPPHLNLGAFSLSYSDWYKPSALPSPPPFGAL